MAALTSSEVLKTGVNTVVFFMPVSFTQAVKSMLVKRTGDRICEMLKIVFMVYGVIIYGFLFEKEMLYATKSFASINVAQQIYQQPLRYFADIVILSASPMEMSQLLLFAS